MSHTIHTDRRGVTLVTSLLLVMLLTIGILAAFARGSADRRSTMDAGVATDAYTVAQNGVDRFFAANPTQPAAASLPLTTTLAVAGGNARVRMERVRAEAGALPAIYLLTSTGVSTGGRYDPRAARAERTVAQLVQWSKAELAGGAALTTLNGIDQQGQPATYDGRNACSPTDTSSWVPGLQMLDADDFEKPKNGKVPEVYGSNGSTIVDMGTLEQALQSLGFSWNTIINSLANVPNIHYATASNNVNSNYSGPSGGFNFPDKSVQPWPIIVVDNATSAHSFKSNQAGHGILIVTGDFETSGNAFGWEGLVLVGGKMTVNGNSTWEGSVFAGLNNDDPLNPSVVMPDNLINGNKTFLYNSCSVSSALTAFAGWTLLPNTRVDNIPNY